MESLCGADCQNCEYGKNGGCKGCKETNGCPFGKQCSIAKMILEEGREAFETLKQKLVEEVNRLGIENMPPIATLVPLNGSFVNLEYPLSNGQTVKFLKDDEMYLGMQAEVEGEKRCFGVVACQEFILICRYEENGINPELVLFKKRGEE